MQIALLEPEPLRFAAHVQRFSDLAMGSPTCAGQPNGRTRQSAGQGWTGLDRAGQGWTGRVVLWPWIPPRGFARPSATRVRTTRSTPWPPAPSPVVSAASQAAVVL